MKKLLEHPAFWIVVVGIMLGLLIWFKNDAPAPARYVNTGSYAPAPVYYTDSYAARQERFEAQQARYKADEEQFDARRWRNNHR
jgi:hypothetical protein